MADRSYAGGAVNTLILNRESFKVPDDCWYQLAPLGEFPHGGPSTGSGQAGIVQVIDAEACEAMASRFQADAAVANFAGLLVDFDHFSLDDRARSEAAGWIVNVEGRDTGLWANIRWSDLGEEAVKGGRYRFLSPVWARSDCFDLGNGRVRPVRLMNAAVTNDPNLKGLVPLANTSTSLSAGAAAGAPVDSCASIGVCIEQPAFVPTRCAVGTTARRPKGPEGTTMKKVIEKLVNHLGLPGDATEDVILEKMQGLPGMTAVADLQNSLKQAQDERDALKADLQNTGKQAQADKDALQGKLKGAEDELVNRHLAEFEGVISEGTKPFWKEQLLTNRQGALLALADVAKGPEVSGKDERPVSTDKSAQRDECPGGTRKPLHNRATARPVIPAQGGGPAAGSGQAESKAVKIRNRAHEIAKGEGVAFSMAFRRAEKEVLEG